MDKQKIETVRPFDVLINSKGKEIVVELKNGYVYKGKLKAFDIHTNLVLFDTKETIDKNENDVNSIFIRGDAILTIKGL